MLRIIDMGFENVQPNTQSLPLAMTQGAELLLTSIWLTISKPSIVNIWASVGWEASSPQATDPKLTFIIARSDGTTIVPIHTTAHSESLNAATQTLTYTASFNTSEEFSQAAGSRNYRLLARLDMGSASIVGPVSLTGEVIAF